MARTRTGCARRHVHVVRQQQAVEPVDGDLVGVGHRHVGVAVRSVGGDRVGIGARAVTACDGGIDDAHGVDDVRLHHVLAVRRDQHRCGQRLDVHRTDPDIADHQLAERARPLIDRIAGDLAIVDKRSVEKPLVGADRQRARPGSHDAAGLRERAVLGHVIHGDVVALTVRHVDKSVLRNLIAPRPPCPRHCRPSTHRCHPRHRCHRGRSRRQHHFHRCPSSRRTWRHCCRRRCTPPSRRAEAPAQEHRSIGHVLPILLLVTACGGNIHRLDGVPADYVL